MLEITPESKKATKTLVARVLLETSLPQLDHLFDYLVPESLHEEISFGQRVKVPFRSRKNGIFGFVIEVVEESEFGGRLAVLSEIVSPVAVLTPKVWELARFLADRAGGSVGDILRLAVPPRQVRVEKAFLKAKDNPLEVEKAWVLPSVSSLAYDVGKKLLMGEKFFAKINSRLKRLPSGEWVLAWSKWFAEVAVTVLEEGKSTIIVVPDFRDIEQLVSALESLGIDNYIRLDSKISNASRYNNFLETLEDKPRIIIGNRAAAYSAAYNLGAILLWDDLDDSLREPLSPYVHARDAALVRAAKEQLGLMFAGHLPSLQVLRLIDIKHLNQLTLGSFKPTLLHTGSLTVSEDMAWRIPEFVLRQIRMGLREGPVLVQVWGAGYGSFVACESCGTQAKCQRCSGHLRAREENSFECKLCGSATTQWHCELCNAQRLQVRGAGSKRTAEQFQEMFKGEKIILSDREHRVMRVDARAALVVATRGAEPIAAGGYKTIIVLDVEKALGAPFLNATEQTLRSWNSLKSLASAESKIVLAGGAGPVVNSFLMSKEYEFLQKELADRKLLRFPPVVRIASVTGPIELVNEAVTKLYDIQGVDFLGPVKLETGETRVIVRFDYARGSEVAIALRAELLRVIANVAARKHVRGKDSSKKFLVSGTIRLRFDDETVFDELGQTE